MSKQKRKYEFKSEKRWKKIKIILIVICCFGLVSVGIGAALMNAKSNENKTMNAALSQTKEGYASRTVSLYESLSSKNVLTEIEEGQSFTILNPLPKVDEENNEYYYIGYEDDEGNSYFGYIEVNAVAAEEETEEETPDATEEESDDTSNNDATEETTSDTQQSSETNSEVQEEKVFILKDVNLATSENCVSNDCVYTSSSWTNKDVYMPSTESLQVEGNVEVSYYEISAGENVFDASRNSVSKDTWVRYDYVSSSVSYNSLYVLKEEGSWIRKIRAVAADGTYSNVLEFNINIDKTAPQISSIANSYENKWTNKSYKIKMSGKDTGGSGIENWYWSWENRFASAVVDNKATANGDKTQYVSSDFVKERSQKVYYWVKDKAGNVSKESSSMIKIDKTGPTINSINNPTKEKWTNKNFSIKMTASDSGSGIKDWYWSYTAHDNNPQLDKKGTFNKNKTSYTSSEFTKENNRRVYYWVLDNAGNWSKQYSTWIKIDKTKPQITSVSNPTGGKKTKSSFKIHMKGKDTGGSGIENWYWSWKSGDPSPSVDKGSSVSSDKTDFYTSDFEQERNQKVYYWIKDNAGNWSKGISENIYIDKTPTTKSKSSRSSSSSSKSSSSSSSCKTATRYKCSPGKYDSSTGKCYKTEYKCSHGGSHVPPYHESICICSSKTTYCNVNYSGRWGYVGTYKKAYLNNKPVKETYCA